MIHGAFFLVGSTAAGSPSCALQLVRLRFSQGVGVMARFAGLGLEPILADSDDDDGDMAFRRGGFGMRGGEDRNGGGGRRDEGNDAVRE